MIYSFSFSTKNTLVQNGKVIVVLPSEISIPDTNVAINDCKGTKNGGAEETLSCTVTSSQVTINDWFSAADFTGSITLAIGGFRNPRSLASSSSFTLKTTDSSELSIDEATSGLAVTMTSVNALQSVAINPQSTTNGASTNY